MISWKHDILERKEYRYADTEKLTYFFIQPVRLRIDNQKNKLNASYIAKTSMILTVNSSMGTTILSLFNSCKSHNPGIKMKLLLSKWSSGFSPLV